MRFNLESRNTIYLQILREIVTTHPPHPGLDLLSSVTQESIPPYLPSADVIARRFLLANTHGSHLNHNLLTHENNREVNFSLRQRQRVREHFFLCADIIISCVIHRFLFVIVVVVNEMEAMSRSSLCVQKSNENDSDIFLSFS